MKRNFSVLYFLFICTGFIHLQAQQGFIMPEGTSKVKMPFDLVNNLIVVPVEINGVALSFVVDTGVNVSLLFSVNKDSLSLVNPKTVVVKGLGDNNDIEALKSVGNIMRVDKLIDSKHTLYVILDKKMNISSRMGVPIHGILGYEFFKNYKVKINYLSKNITLYKTDFFKKRHRRNYKEFDLLLKGKKPYLRGLQINNIEKDYFLIDTGSSDGLWVFEESGIINKNASNYFLDYLGLGLGGEIYGKRTKVSSLKIGDFKLKNVLTAVPSFENGFGDTFIDNRDGSIGGEILSRYHVILDYKQNKIYLKKNINFDKPFYYNMSGLTIEHKGMNLVKEYVSGKSISFNNEENFSSSTTVDLSKNFIFYLTPSLIVSTIQDGSAAYLADIRVGDEIMSINNKKAHRYKLYELNKLFSYRPYKNIFFTIKRNGKLYKKKIKLKPLL